MKFKTCVCCAVLVTFAADGAGAADLGGKRRTAPPPDVIDYAPSVTPPIWQGLYWGVSLGYGWGDSEHFYDRNDNHGTESTEPTGGIASVTLGYNHNLGNGFVVGIEGDLGLMDLSADDKVIFDGHVWKSEFGPFWASLRARAGWLLGQRTLVYATGGWAITEVNEVGYGDADGQTATNEKVRSGWVVGAGVEHAFAPGMTAKIEYLHMDFGRYDGYSENREDYYFENRIDLVRAGLNFKY
jgi:outer membrane immunogenic protein